MKPLLHLLFLLTAATAFASEIPIPPKNIIHDGSFTQGGKNWHFFDTRAGEFLPSGGPDGGPCFKITNGAANYVYLYNKGTRRGWGIVLEEGKTYTMSAWMKTENLDLSTLHRQSTLFVINYGWKTSVNLAPRGGTSDWQRYSVTFQAPAQQRKVPQTANPYSMLLFWPPKAKGTLYLAKIQIEEGDRMTDFTNLCNLHIKSALSRQRELTDALQRYADAVKGRASQEAIAAALHCEAEDIAKQLPLVDDEKKFKEITKRQELLNKKLAKASCRLYIRHPFALTSQDDLPGENDDLTPRKWTMLANTTRSLTLMATNFTGTTRDYRISFSDFTRTQTGEICPGDTFCRLYAMPLLKGLHEPDRLFTDLLADAGKFGMLTIPSGSTRMMMVSIDTTRLMPGEYRGRILMTDLADSSRSRFLPVTLNVLPVALPEKAPFTVGPFGQQRMNEIICRHLGNNLQILRVVGFEGRVDSKGNLIPTDYTGLRENIRQALSVDKNCRFMILFAAGVRFHRNALRAKCQWSDPRVKKAWQQWCRETSDVFTQLGVPLENVYLQVADEPGGGTAALLTEMLKLAREAAPHLRLTTTLTGFDLKTPGNREYYESLDHVVLTTRALREAPDALEFFRSRNIEVANYDCWSVMETIDPTAYCRRQMIYAQQHALSGCFYWFRDDRLPNYQAVNSMSVIYPRRDGDLMRTNGPLLDGEEFDISRRYLAYQAGLQDAKLLALLEEAMKRHPGHPLLPQIRSFINDFHAEAEAFYDKAHFPRYNPQGRDPGRLDLMHEKGALLANELLQQENFELKLIRLSDGKLTLAFNEPCTIQIAYRVNGGMTLRRMEGKAKAASFECNLAEDGGQVNYCRIKAVNSSGKVLECSPFAIPKVTVDSCFNGYGKAALTDGIRVPGAEYWSMLCWLSEAKAQTHWVRLDWEKPRTIFRVRLYWMSRNGLPLERRIETLQDGAWRQAVPSLTPVGAVETLEFPPVSTTAVRIVIPAGKGSRHLPSMVGLSEVEIE